MPVGYQGHPDSTTSSLTARPPPLPPPTLSSGAFIINDWDEAVTGDGWQRGSYRACGDSHGEELDYHHDNGLNKGRVSATYSLAGLPAPGCYEVFEWHPGSGEACRKYMPTSMPVTIRHSRGETRLVVDQSTNGRQWNPLGHFLFQDLSEATIIASNEGTTTCEASICYAIFDAYKFVPASEEACPHMPPPMPPALPWPPQMPIGSPPPLSPLCAHDIPCTTSLGTVTVLLLAAMPCVSILLLLATIARWRRHSDQLAAAWAAPPVTSSPLRSSRAEALRRAIEALPTREWQGGEGEGECAVCLGEFVQGESVKLLPCGHGYHGACIDKWLLGQTAEPRCPLCKAVAIRPEAAEASAGASAGAFAEALAEEAGTELQPTPLPRAQASASVEVVTVSDV